VVLHNLADRSCQIDLGTEWRLDPKAINFADDSDYGDPLPLGAVELRGYGYRWFRVRTAP
jgi:hypothetical protein